MGPPLEEEEVEEVEAVVVVVAVAIVSCFILFFSDAALLYLAPSLSSLEATIREVSPSLTSPRALRSRGKERERLFSFSLLLQPKEESSATAATATTKTLLKMPFWFLLSTLFSLFRV